MMGWPTQFFLVTAFDENSRAAGGVAAFNVAPAITHEMAAGEINLQGLSGIEDHAGRGLAAAGIGSRVIGRSANFDPIERDGLAQVFMHGFDDFESLGASANIRLIGHHHELEAALPEKRTRFGCFRIELKFFHRLRRIGLSFTNDGRIENAIAVEKDGPVHDFAVALSHLVWAWLIFGCETSRCQTTA